MTVLGLKLSKAELYLEKTGCLSKYLLGFDINFCRRWQIGCLRCTGYWCKPYRKPINKTIYTT